MTARAAQPSAGRLRSAAAASEPCAARPTDNNGGRSRGAPLRCCSPDGRAGRRGIEGEGEGERERGGEGEGEKRERERERERERKRDKRF